MNVSVVGEYQGDFEQLKETLNETTSQLNTIVADITIRMKHFAEGNLDLDPAVEYQGDFLEISYALNTIVDALNLVMHDIHSAAEQVGNGASQLSDSSQSLAQGATEQASAIEELTATILKSLVKSGKRLPMQIMPENLATRCG